MPELRSHPHPQRRVLNRRYNAAVELLAFLLRKDREEVGGLIRRTIEQQNKVHTRAQGIKQKLNGARMRPHLGPMTISQPRLDTVLNIVAKDYRVSVACLRGPRRQPRLVLARHVAMYLMYAECEGVSTPEIGRAIGNRDHTTVLHGKKKVEGTLPVDAEFHTRVEKLRERVRKELKKMS